MAIDKEGRPSFLVESCLLAFGLPSVGEEELAREWEAAGAGDALICWVEDGEIVVGTIERFLSFR